MINKENSDARGGSVSIGCKEKYGQKRKTLSGTGGGDYRILYEKYLEKKVVLIVNIDKRSRYTRDNDKQGGGFNSSCRSDHEGFGQQSVSGLIMLPQNPSLGNFRYARGVKRKSHEKKDKSKKGGF